ncbi:MAG: DUF2490 domain-containing protein [Bdellovibrionales bacterium]|nr:DUF2490 domain-containing protein [Bdellovibrionales bacterium]
MKKILGVRVSTANALVVISLLFSSLPAARGEEVMQDSGFWGLGILRAPIAESWRVYFEYQVRYMQQARQYERLLVRPAVIYDFSPQLSLFLGYGWTPTFQPVFNDENRFWQMLTYKVPMEGWTFQTWNRVEERNIQGIHETAYRFRSRQFLTQKTQPQEWGASFWDEIFFHLSNSSAEIRTGFDQNRAFLGAQYRFSTHVVLEVGYMNLLVNRYALDDRMQHTFLLGLYTDL